MSSFVIVIDNKVSNTVIAESHDDAVALFGDSVIEYDPAVLLPKIGWDVVDGEIIDPNPNIVPEQEVFEVPEA
jgi:hypothetical protein